MNETALRCALAVTLCLAGCAGRAPALPADYGSVEARERVPLASFDAVSQKLTCTEIDAEIASLSEGRAVAETDIADKRGQNQVAGYLGAIFILPALLATDNSTQAKDKIARIDLAKDKLFQLRSVKKCPALGQAG